MCPLYSERSVAFLYRVATDYYRGFPVVILKAVLRLLSLVYCPVVVLAASCASRRKLPLRVVSVGNITLGGTGKTPLVELIVRYLKEDGRRPAVLTRGYALKGAESADEPRMLSERTGGVPVIVNPDRCAGANEAIDKHAADIAVLDDGFQQWRIERDLDIVTIDATRPFGNRAVLPRGILREPLSALKRADIFVLTKVDLCPDLSALREELDERNRSALIVESHHLITGFYKLADRGSRRSVEAMHGIHAAVVSGIGDPASFERMLAALGIGIAVSFPFPDHHEYSPADISRIAAAVRGRAITAVITTEKDAVRLSRLDVPVFGCDVYVATLELVLTAGKDQFRDRLRQLSAV